MMFTITVKNNLKLLKRLRTAFEKHNFEDMLPVVPQEAYTRFLIFEPFHRRIFEASRSMGGNR